MANSLIYDAVEAAFPVEIFSLIIKNLVTGDRSNYLPTLKSLGLTSKAFTSLCRPYIFQSISYGPFGEAKIARRHFIELFTREPDVAQFVTSVKYVLKTDDDPPIDLEAVQQEALRRCLEENQSVGDEENALDRPPGTAEGGLIYSEYMEFGGFVDEYPPSLHTLLPNVEKLTIHHISCHESPANSSLSCINQYCTALSRRVLEEFSDSTIITSLTITGISEIEMWNVFDFESLEELEMERCDIEGWLDPLDDEFWGSDDEEEDEDDHGHHDDDKEQDANEDDDEAEDGGGREDGLEPSDSDGEDEDKSDDAYLHLPKLTKLKVHDTTGFVFKIIYYLPHLQFVDLQYLEYGDDSEFTLYQKYKKQTEFKNLHTIITDNVGDWASLFDFCGEEEAIPFPSIKVLDVRLCDQNDVDSMDSLYQHASGLESLAFRSGARRNRDVFIDGIDLNSFIWANIETLKHITINWYHTDYEAEQSVISSLHEALEGSEGQNVLETINVTLDIGSMVMAALIPKPSFEEWRYLDDLLMNDREKDFPHLRQVSLKIIFGSTYCPPMTDSWVLRQFLRKPLRKLHRASNLDFTGGVVHGVLV
ncbi:hypothetical protein BJ165DRAFT_1452541 [Panaeolus papilionaceus]|nr:hypothetical protein BJ165DRAFT_1452541 [Panaeolus papilionaceus]